MEDRRFRFVKLVAILAASALLVTTMVGGGIMAVGSPAGPVRASHTVSVKRLKAATPAGNALLILQFDNKSLSGKRLDININNRPTAFRDDGTFGDEVAGDGKLSAPVTLDFASLTANQRRVQAAAAKTGAAPQMPVFNGRVFVGQQPLALPLSSGELQPGQEVRLEALADPSSIDPARSLIIPDPSVVEDPDRTFNPCTGVGTPMGVWTFGYLMQEMANQPATGIDPSAFTRTWLKNWENNLIINGWSVAARQRVKDIVITPWEAASGGPGAPLNLKIAPFKLLAIVNRIDLRGTGGYTTNNAGEARFVFGVIDRRNKGCVVSEMTVILEYGIDRPDCDGVIDWARQWVNLSSLPLGSSAYLAALEAITEQFAKAGAAPAKVNGSALNQVRTNEFLRPSTGP